MGENGLEWRAIVRKEHLGGNKKLEKLFQQKKCFQVLATGQIVTDLQFRYTEVRKVATSAVKKSKEKSWEAIYALMSLSPYAPAPLCRRSPRGTADNQFLRILFSHPQKSLSAPLIENRCFKLFKKLILGYTLEDFIVGTRKQ